MALSTRRRFLKQTLAGGALLLVDPLAARSRAAVPTAADAAFSQGVAAGEPAARGMTLWTHLDGIDRPVRVGLEVSDDPGFGRLLVAAETVADPAAGGSARVRVDGGPLRAGEQYWYRFTTGDADSPVGRFRTLRPADSREPVTIAFLSCQEFIAGHYHAHRDLAGRDDVDLVVCLGDYIYEQAFADTLSAVPPVREDHSAADGEVQTLDEYRAKYALHHTDAALLAVRAAFPLAAVWDDHEVEDNYADGLPGGATQHRRLPFLQRRANGYRAWHEAMPRLSVADEPTYGLTALGTVDLLRLDTRRYRDDQPCNPTDGPFVLGCGADAYNAPGRTLLGATQKAWLKDALAASQAPWKVIANQVMIMSLDAPPGWPLNTDAWDGYGAERRELLEYLQTAGIEDVAFITGDIHTFFAGEVSPSGRRYDTAAGPGAPPVATEFVGGSITSPGIVDRFVSAERDRNGLALPIDLAVWLNNPHIRFSNQSYKGYGLLRATRQELRVSYRAVHDTRLATSTAFTLATFRVRRGRARVEVTGLSPAILNGAEDLWPLPTDDLRAAYDVPAAA